METIEEVLTAAIQFQMKNVIEVCDEFLKMQLTKENLIEIQNLSEKYALKDTVRKTKRFLQNHFLDISDIILLRLTAKQLTVTLNSNSWNIPNFDQEFCLFEKVLFWIEGTSDLAEDTVYDILSKIRFPFMSKENLSRVSESEVMRSYPRCQKLLSEALEYHKDVLKQPLMQNERTQIRDDLEVFIVASGNTMNIISTEGDDCSWNYQHDELKAVKPYETNDFDLKELVVIDNFLYASHVLHRTNDPDSVLFHRYDPRFNVWQRLPEPPMKWDLSLVLVPCKRNIYAVDRGDASLQLEVFSIENNKWDTKASVQTRYRYFAGHAFQDKIYISGGEDSEKSDHRVYCYTPSSDTWETKAPMVKARKSHKMAEINNKLYAFGGDASNSVEYYLPGDDQWTLCERNLEFPVYGLAKSVNGLAVFGIMPIYDDYYYDTKNLMHEIAIEMYEPDHEPESETPYFVSSYTGFRFKYYKKVMCTNLTISQSVPEEEDDGEGDAEQEVNDAG